ncbi:programmed cell death protein 2 [Syncephalis fuscata]|nr:programmed cell death protein 2 [Syncephalis fuscata]
MTTATHEQIPRRASICSNDSASDCDDSLAPGKAKNDEEPAVIQLGFAERVDEDEREEAFSYESFPSKIGGRPVWLNPTKPLAAARVLCGVCKDPMTFLLQLYAPEDQPAEAFHRTIYVYCCPKGACHQKSWRDCFRVLRSQLPQDNSFYKKRASTKDTPTNKTNNKNDDDGDWNANDEDLTDDEAPVWQLNCNPATECVLCGLNGSKQCARCHAVSYCARPHQILDWTVGGHREQCGKTTPDIDDPLMKTRREKCLFDEREIVSEPEGSGEESINPDALELPHRMAGLNITEMRAREDKEAMEEEYEDTEVHVDAAFLAFQRRIARYPDQVIRYARVEYTKTPAQPLWVSDIGMPSETSDIVACSHCGAERTFEFQILPQILNFLRIDHSASDALDWGTLAIYTCTRNCHVPDEAYVDELIWRQEFSRDGLQDRVTARPPPASTSTPST